ncbi:RING finger protein nhl-1-like [Gigantopelta aegis]|uniref:RING finger protein nhl-1-like n=1 Tax=Gigantopelta aegis TaxID=1735272 RepID=UPI001B88D775|nr:RING finger protein nhl-1-like [Gigantopelta aegis]
MASIDEVVTSPSKLLPVKQEIKCSEHNKSLEIFCGTHYSNNFILVADNHKIQKISMDGKCITSVGKQGMDHWNLHVPRGIAISLITGQIYIADESNHRIQVLNSDLTFSHTFGLKGSAEGQLILPADVSIDRQGVSDSENEIREQDEVIKEEIYVMVEEMIDVLRQSERQLTREVDTVTDKDGKKGKSFGLRNGFRNVKFFHPRGVAITPDNFILVADEHKIQKISMEGKKSVTLDQEGNHCVSIFTSDGQFVRAFGAYGSSVGQFNLPNGITFDRDGCCYVCDMYNNRLVEY